VRTAHDVVFDEGRGWAWDKAVDDGSTLPYDNFTVAYVHFEGAGGVGSSFPPSMSTSIPEPLPTSVSCSPATTSATTRSSPPPPQPVTPCTLAATAAPPSMSTLTPARVENPVEFATPLSHDEELIDAYNNDESLRYCTMENLLDDQSVPGLSPHDLEAQLHLPCDDGEPRSFAEAERHASWHASYTVGEPGGSWDQQTNLTAWRPPSTSKPATSSVCRHHRYQSHSSQSEFNSILNNACFSRVPLQCSSTRRRRTTWWRCADPATVPARRRAPRPRSGPATTLSSSTASGWLLHLRRAGPLRRRDEAGGQCPPGRLRQTTSDKQRDVRVERQRHGRRHLPGGRLATDRHHHP
jgi:hypothetical protein